MGVEQLGYFVAAAPKARTVWSVGINLFGQLGLGYQSAGWQTPAPVLSLTGVTTVTGAWGDSGFAIRSDGTLWGWGHNSTDDDLFMVATSAPATG